MPINELVYNLPAKRGDISGTAIRASIALHSIANALELIANGQKPTSEQIASIREQAAKLDGIFDQLTGFTK